MVVTQELGKEIQGHITLAMLFKVDFLMDNFHILNTLSCKAEFKRIYIFKYNSK